MEVVVLLLTELGISLVEKGHEVHFISYSQPFRLDVFSENTFFMKLVFQITLYLIILHMNLI